MIIQILIDNPDSWIIPYAKDLQNALSKRKHTVSIIHDHKDVTKGDVLCLLACEKKFSFLELNNYNLVVHESDLPKGRGWSPLTWQIIQGINQIPITLFEATNDIDAGDIYLQKFIELNGDELLPEIKHKQGLLTNELIIEFIENIEQIIPIKQTGEATYYPRRNTKDSKLDEKKTIEQQFNLLRVCDNERYPAFFEMFNQKYVIKIYKYE
jgi:methionyl-tRNA formyltransferase